MLERNPDWVLGIDFETTGLHPENDKDVPIEVGAVLWDWKARKPVACVSELIILDPSRTLTVEIQDLTGITPDMLVAPIAVPEPQVIVRVLELATRASYFMAHNAKFDREFFNNALRRNFLSMQGLPWLDTLTDVPYPPSIKSRSLSYLATDHKFLNPFAHRAVFDVLTMFEVAGRYPLEEIVALSSSPTLRLVGTFPREHNEVAKACGFKWNPDRRQWWREVKESQMQGLKIEVTYRIEDQVV